METFYPLDIVHDLDSPMLLDLLDTTSRIVCLSRRGPQLPANFKEEFESLAVRSKSAFEPDHVRLEGPSDAKNRARECKTESPPATKGTKSKKKPQKSLSPSLVFITVTEPEQIKTRRNQQLINHHSMKEAIKKEKLEGRRRPKTSKSFHSSQSARSDCKALESYGSCGCRLWESPEAAESDLESLREGFPLTCLTCGNQILWPENGSTTSERRERPLSIQSANPSPRSLLGAGRVDPFQTYPAKGERVDYLIDFCESNPTNVSSLESIASPLVASKEVGTHSAYLSTIFSIGFVNAAFFNTLLCSVSLVTNAGKMTTETLTYKGEAIRLLNDRLRDPAKATDDASLATIISLANFDCRTDDRDSCDAHMKGVAQMIKLRTRSGTPESDLMIRCVFWADLLTAVMSGRKRLFNHETFPELRWTLPRPPKFNWLTSEAFPSGFQSHLPVLDTPLLEIIQDLVFLKDSILTSTTSRRSSDGAPSTLPIVQQFDNGAASIDSRLHDLKFLYPGDLQTNPAADPLKECIRLALSLLSNALFNDSWDAPFVLTHFSTKLAAALFRSDLATHWNEHIDLLLWVLFLGGSYAPKQAPTRQTYVALIADTCGFLGLLGESWESVEGVLHTFVWETKVFNGRGMLLWNEIREPRGW